MAAIASDEPEVSPSTLYAAACILEGAPFINGSPQNTFVPGLIELAVRNNVLIGGDDFKSGQVRQQIHTLDLVERYTRSHQQLVAGAAARYAVRLLLGCTEPHNPSSSSRCLCPLKAVLAHLYACFVECCVVLSCVAVHCADQDEVSTG
jgi:hypothetical protein